MNQEIKELKIMIQKELKKIKNSPSHKYYKKHGYKKWDVNRARFI